MKYPFEGENILKISNKDSDNSEYQTLKKKSHQVWTLSLQHNILTCLFFYSSVRKEALALDNPVFKFPILSETNNCNYM